MHLKKILSKPVEMNTLNMMIQHLQLDVSVRDHQGKVIFGGEECGANEHAIEVDGLHFGTISGSGEVSPVLSMIQYFCRSELERKALAKETLDKYKEISLLFRISERINSSLDIRQIALMVMEEAKKAISGTGGCILIYNPEKGRLESALNFGMGIGKNSAMTAFNLFLHMVYQEGKADIVNDVSANAMLPSNYQPEISSLIYAPLKTNDRNVGIFMLVNSSPVNYTANDLRLLSTLASQTAGAIENARLYDEQREAFYATVKTLSDIVEMRDPQSGGHAQRVTHYCQLIGKKMGLGGAELARLKLASLLHDIGKIGVDDALLTKRRELTVTERRDVAKHAVLGAEILDHIKQLKDIVPVVRGHHERYDGLGTPDGLKGNDIPLGARIIAVADSYDELTTDKQFRGALSSRDAFKQIIENASTCFDPDVVNALSKII